MLSSSIWKIAFVGFILLGSGHVALAAPIQVLPSPFTVSDIYENTKPLGLGAFEDIYNFLIGVDASPIFANLFTFDSNGPVFIDSLGLFFCHGADATGSCVGAGGGLNLAGISIGGVDIGTHSFLVRVLVSQPNISYKFSINSPDPFSVSAPIPEPSTMLLFGTGLAALVGWRYRKGVKV